MSSSTHRIVQSYKLQVIARSKIELVKYFLRSEILVVLRLMTLLSFKLILYIQLIYTKKYMQVGSCLNRLIAYFHKINFL